MNDLPYLRHGRSRAVTGENPTGEPGNGGQKSSKLGPGRKGNPCALNIQPGETRVLMDVDGPGVIRHIWMTVTDKTSDENCFVFRDLILKFYWDDESEPSVLVPFGDFFCCGFGLEHRINSVPVMVAPRRGMNMYFPMPFSKHAKVEVVSEHADPIPMFFYQIDYTLYDSLPDDTEYFHAAWRREPLTEEKKDFVIAEIEGIGKYVGTYVGLQTLSRYWWGEGEFKFYIDDDDRFPTINGTGMEDYFGGAWSFATREDGKMAEENYSTPFLGYPFYSRHDPVIRGDYYNDDCPPMRSFFRFHIPDPVFFEKKLRLTLQQIGMSAGGLYERQDDLTAVSYWYQREPHKTLAPLLPAAERWPR